MDVWLVAQMVGSWVVRMVVLWDVWLAATMAVSKAVPMVEKLELLMVA